MRENRSPAPLDPPAFERGALDGVVVADFSQLVQGPAATQTLADLGADVIKIEPPNGDWLRHFSLGGAFREGESVSFLAFNRNKRSITLDLKERDGAAAGRRIVRRADILVENFRPGVMERLGFGYETLRADNPGLIYCSGSGYGETGPYRDRPGQDLLAQATSGWAWLQGSIEGPPEATAVGIADLTAAEHLVIGALAALHQRAATGRGQRVRVNLLRSIMWLQAQELAVFLAGGAAPDETRSSSGIPNPYGGAPYGLYATADGWIAIAMTNVNDLARMVEVDGLGHVDSNNVMDGRDEIRSILAAAIRRRPTAEWMERFTRADVWAVPVQRYGDLVDDPQVAATGVLVGMSHPIAGELRLVGPGVELSEAPLPPVRPAPALGEHTAEILAWAGTPEQTIARMCG